MKPPSGSTIPTTLGTIVHAILESFVEDRSLFDQFKKKKDFFKVSALKEVACDIATCDGIDIEIIKDDINSNVICALVDDFFGPEGSEVKPEQDLVLDFIEKNLGVDFTIKCIIDKVILPPDSDEVHVVDYKSSKKQFDKKDREFNVQAMINCLALSRVYPERTRQIFKFFFTKPQFSKKPWQEITLPSKEEVDAFKLYLTQIQEYINNFSEENIFDNIPANTPNYFPCGIPGRIKKDGTVGWHCDAYLPLSWFVLKNKEGEIVSAAWDSEDLVGEGDVEEVIYSGCPVYFKNGVARKTPLSSKNS